MLYKEKKKPQVSYTCDESAEWNLDILTEYQILKLLKNMVVSYANYTCRDINPIIACSYLVCGFTR